jgi:hypothetical protein
MKQIEHVIDEALALAALERRLQLRKAGNSVLVLDDYLTVDQRRARGKLGDGGGGVRKFFAPLEALTREQTHVAVIEPRLDAVAVELDLVRPASPGRRRLVQGR